jgi:protein-S-isoprenylcysteine O-methyltransferase Ste14
VADEQNFHNPESSSASKLFDLRYLIGGLFTLYVVIVTIAGITASSKAKQKADGININLWMGLGMLALGLLFLLWAWLRPLRQPVREAAATQIRHGRHLRPSGRDRDEDHDEDDDEDGRGTHQA